jgi:hypothetical protein
VNSFPAEAGTPRFILAHEFIKFAGFKGRCVDMFTGIRQLFYSEILGALSQERQHQGQRFARSL